MLTASEPLSSGNSYRSAYNGVAVAEKARCRCRGGVRGARVRVMLAVSKQLSSRNSYSLAYERADGAGRAEGSLFRG